MKNNNSCIFISLIIFVILFALTLPLFLANDFNTATSLNLLSYYGSILGAGATIGAVWLTIDFNKKQIEDERINNETQRKQERSLSVKPYLEAQFLQIFPADHLSHKESIDYDYTYFKIKLDTGNITACTGFPDDLKQFKKGFNESTSKQEYLTIKYTLSNVGAGNALQINMKLNNETVCADFALQINAQKIFVFLFILSEETNTHEQSIRLVYEFSDIYSYKTYQQISEFSLGPSLYNHHMCLFETNSRISPPKELPRIPTPEKD